MLKETKRLFVCVYIYIHKRKEKKRKIIVNNFFVYFKTSKFNIYIYYVLCTGRLYKFLQLLVILKNFHEIKMYYFLII